MSRINPTPKERQFDEGRLMQVLLDESLRHGQWLDHPPLRNWLAGFSGSTAAAKLAKALQARQA